MQIGVSPKKLPSEVSRLAMLPDVTTVLCRHPAVRDAVACRLSHDDHDSVVAFVLTNEGYIDSVRRGKEAENSQIRKWRKTHDLSQLAKAAAGSPFAFNIAGWNSSYNLQPLPPEDMQEWVDTTVNTVSTLLPREVLEIGCGTGLLLLRLAPTCKRYVGVDFAPSVLMRLKEQLAQSEPLREKVELFERPADDFEGFQQDSFDTVILNSVVQYFPSQAYLSRVLENSVRVVRPGGQVFIGDLRNLVLLRAYAVSIGVFQATPEMSVEELRGWVGRRIAQERELVLSPSYFLSLGGRLPRVSSVEIYPRRGRRDNEMTRFRYDAVLRVETGSGPVCETGFFDPPADGWELGTVRSLLATQNRERVGFARIRNSRIDRDMRWSERLQIAEPQPRFSELCREVDASEPRGIHPEEIADLAAATGYDVALSWAACYRDGSYDAVFLRRASDQRALPPVDWPQPTAAHCVYYSNAPGQSEIRNNLVDELVSHCRTRLPDPSVPARVHLVDSFPCGSDGQVDCEALLAAASVAAGA